MLVEIFTLILISLIQVTLLPLDLVLVFLICRSFISPEKNNLYLAFSFGLVLSLMTGQPIGILSLIYVAFVEIVQIIQKTELANFWLSILPVSLLLLILQGGFNMLFFGISINFMNILSQAIISLPCFFLLRLWNERFIPNREVRLKVKG